MKRFYSLILLLAVGFAALGQSSGGVRLGLRPLVYGLNSGDLYLDLYTTLDGSTVAAEQNAQEFWEMRCEVALRVGEKLDALAFVHTSVDSASGVPLLLQKSTFVVERGARLPIEVVVRDAVLDEVWTLRDTLEVGDGPFWVADALLLDPSVEEAPELYAKGGIAVVPVPSIGQALLDESTAKVRWYSEVYADSGAYLLQYRLVDAGANLVPGSSSFKRIGPGANPVSAEFDLTDLVTGAYGLELTLKDRKGALLETKLTPFMYYNRSADSAALFADVNWIEREAFERSWGSWEDVPEYLSMIAPVADLAQRRLLMNLKEAGDTGRSAQFLVQFWKLNYPSSPLESWKAYQQVVEKVDREFGSKTLAGYKTAMGRVFLQYGAPSLVEERPFDGKNYPYQIWQYDELRSSSTPVQQNQVFIFVDQELVGRQYTLIHSSALGEVKDHKWQFHLSRHTNAGPDIDATSAQYSRDNFGERISNSLIIGNQGTWFDTFNR